MPTAAELQAEALEKSIKTLLEQPLPDTTYVNEWKLYQSWVVINRDAHNLDPAVGRAKHITRKNVDAYYLHVVVDKDGNKNTANRVCSALQWFANYREHPAGGFVVKSPTVEHCVAVQQAKFKTGVSSTDKAGTDPHKGLKDVLPESDRRTIMDHIYDKRNDDWGPASIQFSWGQNAAVRSGSTRNFVLSDQKLSRGLGPEREGPNARALLLVLRKGRVHKDNFSTNQQVCCWRHRNYLLCSVFATALHVISKLVKLGNDINFYHRDKSKRADWWDVELVDWNTYDGK